MIQEPDAQIIIIDDFHPVFIEKLEAAGIKCKYYPEIKAEDVAEQVRPYGMVAVRSKINFTRELLDQLPVLKCIARGGAGMDNIDEQYAHSRNIELLNAPEGNRDAVAEHTIGLLLSMSKKIVSGSREVAEMKWRREANRGWEIGGKTIGLFGFGNTGSSVAKKLSGFDCRVIAYDLVPSKVTGTYAHRVDLKTLLDESDVISFHIPLTSETQSILNSKLIDNMKDGVVLLNTSRGGIAKMTDIVDGIKRGKIKSYACDVLENEKLNEYTEKQKAELKTLIDDYQIIITPHVAGWSVESYYKIGKVLSEKIIDYTTKVKNI